LESLGKCRNRATLRNALKTLPPTLDETYERILRSIRQEDINYAIRILRWLAFSVRPLTIAEIAEVVAIDIDRDPAFDAEEVLEDPLDILNICTSLVTITAKAESEAIGTDYADIDGDMGEETDEDEDTDDDVDKDEDTDEEDEDTDEDGDSAYSGTSSHERTEQYVQLAHYSVKEYLISDRIQQSRARNYGIEAASCNDFLAQSCIAYITHPNIRIPFSDEQPECFDLANYAFRYWQAHVDAAGKMTGALSRRIMDFFLHGNDSYTAWAQYPWVVDWRADWNRAFYGTDRGEFVFGDAAWNESPSPLHIAVCFGWESIVEQLLASGADINSISESIGTPLYVAARMPNEKVVQYLLDAGADVNGLGGRFGGALQAAVTSSYFIGDSYFGKDSDVRKRITEALLSAGANINAENIVYGTALAASVSCGVNVVRVLLNAGAEVNPKGGRFDTPLMMAAFYGDEDVVKLLLDVGADVNEGAQGRSALSHAASTGSTNLVKILLGAGADINAELAEHGTALIAASSRGNRNMVELLLAAGANINAESMNRGTALSAAVLVQSEDVVKSLLGAGADVNAEAGDDGTALIVAARRAGPSVVKLLLTAGADVNTEAGLYGTALITAIVANSMGNFQLLLEHGANVNAELGRYEHLTPITASDCCKELTLARNRNQIAALHVAVKFRRKKMVRLLLERGANANARGGSDGTVVIAAVPKKKILELLILAGADVNIQGHGYYSTALVKAVHEGYEKSVQLLLSAGADTTAQAEIRSFKHQELGQRWTLFRRTMIHELHAKYEAVGPSKCYGSVLEIAAAKGRDKIARLLLDAGADVNAHGGDMFGSLLDAAVYGGSEEIVELLISAGATVDASSSRNYSSVLGAAEALGRTEIVRLLVNAGAVHPS
jgi:ankyrin repeat protein